MSKRAPRDPVAAAKTEPKTALAPIRPVEGALARGERGTLVATERAIGAAEAAAAAGVGIAGLAALLGCSREALRQMRERQPELDAAIERGNASNEFELVSLLMQAARKGAFVPALFLLKAKHGYREGEPPESSRPNVIINLPSALPLDEYLRTIQQRQQRALIEGEKSDVAPDTSLAR
jgi:hypothetical protein